MSQEEQEQQQKIWDPTFFQTQKFFLTQNNFWANFFSGPKRCLEGENKASELKLSKLAKGKDFT